MESSRNELSERQKLTIPLNSKNMTKETYSIKEVCEVLKLPFGNVTLFSRLRREGILDEENSPNPYFYEQNYFKVRTKWREHMARTDYVTLVTNTGLEFIKDIYKKGYLNK